MKAGTKFTGEWVRRFHENDDSKFRLVCFPHAGGSASYFYSMSELLAPTTELLAVQYPGRQDRRSEGFASGITELADYIFDALGAWDSRPFVFFGHSMGSIIAFEVALRFQNTVGRPPAWLFASGYPAPSRLRHGDVHRRDDAGIIAELRALGGMDPSWLDDEELMAVILPAVRSDYRAIETHPHAGDRLACPIMTLVGDTDPHTTITEARAWGEHTSAEFDLRIFPGGHFYLDRHGSDLVDIISATIKKNI